MQVRACFRAVPQASANAGKCAANDADGSRGRRFKSCQPDKKQALTWENRERRGGREGLRFDSGRTLSRTLSVSWTHIDPVICGGAPWVSSPSLKPRRGRGWADRARPAEAPRLRRSRTEALGSGQISETTRTPLRGRGAFLARFRSWPGHAWARWSACKSWLRATMTRAACLADDCMVRRLNNPAWIWATSRSRLSPQPRERGQPRTRRSLRHAVRRVVARRCAEMSALTDPGQRASRCLRWEGQEQTAAGGGPVARVPRAGLRSHGPGPGARGSGECRRSNDQNSRSYTSFRTEIRSASGRATGEGGPKTRL